jgi:hypothetical protein
MDKTENTRALSKTVATVVISIGTLATPRRVLALLTS